LNAAAFLTRPQPAALQKPNCKHGWLLARFVQDSGARDPI